MDTARAVLGYISLTDTDEFYKDIVTAGPYLVIGPGALESMDETTFRPTYGIRCKLYIGMPKWANNNEKNIETFVEALKNAWANDTLYDVGPGPTVTWPEPEVDATLNPMLIRYEFAVSAQSC